MSASITTPPPPWRKGGLSSPPRSGCLLSPFPLLVRKISPEAIFLAYFTGFRHSFPGRRMVRVFISSDIYILISHINFVDMHFHSLILTTVAHMVSIRSSSRSLPRTFAVSKSRMYSSLFSSRSLLRNTLCWILRYFTRQPCQPRKLKNLFRADSFLFTVAGWQPNCFFHIATCSFVTWSPPSQAAKARTFHRYFSMMAGSRSSFTNHWRKVSKWASPNFPF